MTTGEMILIGLCVALALCPPRYDPAIRLKEWLQRDIDRRQHPARICAREGHQWVSYGGRNASCSKDCHCSIPVHECARCGDCDYGDNAEAKAKIEACETARDVRACTCQFGYGMIDGIGYRALDCPVHGEDLPEGLWHRDGKVVFECRGCNQTVELEIDPSEFDPAVAYCGGSPRCLP